MTELEHIATVLSRMPQLDERARKLLSAAAADHPNLAALDGAIRSLSRRPGDYWWIGDECLQCTGIEGGSHRERSVAAYDPELGVSLCPDCGAIVAWPEPPAVLADPRCRECQGRESCPPTLRDGGAGGAGGETTPANAGGER